MITFSSECLFSRCSVVIESRLVEQCVVRQIVGVFPRLQSGRTSESRVLYGKFNAVERRDCERHRLARWNNSL